ncbi:MAG: hypothetical protein JO332_06760 [Planctomycetaceae bacterium]|nr:hypothetical protein [Planctomycetaceae bacterium]
MKHPIQLVLGILFVAVMAANLLWAVRSLHHEEAKPEEKREGAKRLSRDEEGNSVLTLDAAAQQRASLQIEELKEATLPAEQAAYGRFVEDPARSFTLRAPVAGILRKDAAGEWPRLGAVLADGSPVGVLQPRFSPLERVDLQSRLTTSQAEKASATAALDAAKASVERLKALNAENKTASDRSLQEAEARMKAEAARLNAAVETGAAIEASLGARSGATGPIALVCERGGEVVELFAQPGETIESGQAILRVARFDRLLARVALPAGAAVQAPTARILPLGREPLVLHGERAGAAPTDPQLPGDAAYFAVDAGDARLRPGLPLTAFLEVPGEPAKGVLLPRAAVLRLEGERWVWVQTAADKFTRRELEHARPAAAGWFTAEGFKPGDKIVAGGAQLLLSEELKSKIQGED